MLKWLSYLIISTSIIVVATAIISARPGHTAGGRSGTITSSRSTAPWDSKSCGLHVLRHGRGTLDLNVGGIISCNS